MNKINNCLLAALLILSNRSFAQVSPVHQRMGTVSVDFSDSKLVIGTGKLSRVWQWTGKGLATVSLKNTRTQKEWCQRKAGQPADWTIPGLPTLPEGQLRSISAKESTDEGFTGKHLAVTAEIFYPAIQTYLTYTVWAYPNANGLRTQLALKSEQTWPKPDSSSSGIPVAELKVLRVSSVASEKTTPEMLFDSNNRTVWATKVTTAKPLVPNELVVDMANDRVVSGLLLTQFNDYNKLGWIEKCIVYAATDTTNWGVPLQSTELSRADYPQYVAVSTRRARFLKLVIPPTTKLNYSIWQTSLAELRVFTDEYPYQPVDQGRTDALPIDAKPYTRTYVGYKADQQFRNTLTYDFLKEETHQTPFDQQEVSDWSNIFTLENGVEGLAFVKESHKTALQQGHLTGDFRCSEQGVELTGWGLAPDEFTNEYRTAWANWVLVYEGGAEERKLAIKRFDRLRFPITLPGHKQIYANSWGYGYLPEADWRQKMNGALEPNVLSALKVAREMGIENYLIDVGWSETPETPKQVFPYGHRPHPVYYPNGWQTVKKAARDNQVNLTLWTDVGIKPEDMTWNQQQAGFMAWKLDFANLTDYKGRNSIERKARTFIRQFNHQVSLNWDLTEVMPRYGFFWAREYGIIYLTNREPNAHILFTPSVALRDAWDLAQYMNTNKFHLTIRNVRDVAPPSDARLHSQEYAVATALVGIPMFLEKIENYTSAERSALKKLLTLYKQERDVIFENYVFPVGDQPSNASFTGFQFADPDTQVGHLLLFRELYSTKADQDIKLHFLKNKQIKLVDIRTNTEKMVSVSSDGVVKFSVDKPADFKFYRYETVPPIKKRPK